jgi:hypothetical protein
MKSSWLAWWVAVVAVSSLAASAGQAVPRLKPGLWAMQVHSSAGGHNTALPSTVCVGAMPQQQWRLEDENARSRCSKFDSREVARRVGGRCRVLGPRPHDHETHCHESQWGELPGGQHRGPGKHDERGQTARPVQAGSEAGRLQMIV